MKKPKTNRKNPRKQIVTFAAPMPKHSIREKRTPMVIGNAVWEQRSKHGREKLFASPMLLLEAAIEYFKWCDANPIMVAERGNGGRWERDDETDEETPKPDIIEVPKARVYTLHALCGYLDCDTSYFRMFKSVNAGREEFSDYLTVIKKIEDIIYDNKFTGATAGLFNANIISRDLGLTEKTQSEVIQYNITPTAKETIEIAKALDKRI